MPDQEYFITDNAIPYTHPAFQAEPAFCPVVYSYAIEQLANGNDIITITNEPTNADGQIDAPASFSTYYKDDLTPVVPTIQIITVTVTATGQSGWTVD